MKSHKPLAAILFIGIIGFTMTASCSSEKDQPAQNPSAQTNTTTTPASTPAADPNQTPGTPAAEKTEGARVSAVAVTEKILCPEYTELKKVGLFWSAPNGWKSYSQSFLNELTSFVEAQWHGVNVGKLMCVYVGSGKREFPVVLQNDVLTKMPDGFKWGQYKPDESMVSCVSTNINDCPTFHTKRDVDIKKAYEELDFKKGEDLN